MFGYNFSNELFGSWYATLAWAWVSRPIYCMGMVHFSSAPKIDSKPVPFKLTFSLLDAFSEVYYSLDLSHTRHWLQAQHPTGIQPHFPPPSCDHHRPTHMGLLFDNLKTQVLPNPLKAAEDINKRLASYEKAWHLRSVQQGSTSQSHRASTFGDLTFYSDASVQQNSTWLGVICTNCLGSLLAAQSYETATTSSEIRGAGRNYQSHGMRKYHAHQTAAKDLVTSLQSNNFNYQPRLASHMTQAQDPLLTLD